MKVIDLLNKIANKEEVPKKIKYEYDYYELKEKYNEDWEQWEYGYQAHTGGYLNIWRKDVLNDEVEIIEEPQEHKIIEKWQDLAITTMRKQEDSIDDDIKKIKSYIGTIMRTQNEIIEYLEDNK